MKPEGRRNALVGAAAYVLAWIALSFLASSLVEGMPNLWWFGIPTGVVFYLILRRLGGFIGPGRRP